MHPRDDTAFIQTQLHKRAGHSILLKPWPLLSSLHLKMESTRLQKQHRITSIMELTLINAIMAQCAVPLTIPYPNGAQVEGWLHRTIMDAGKKQPSTKNAEPTLFWSSPS
jgi:hypothetical protein